MNPLKNGQWINSPKKYTMNNSTIQITTDPGTDFWQRTFYGFKNKNAPALLLETRDNFTFTTKITFTYKRRFDQCGLILYIDDENWFKASIEYENKEISRLGSVVTNHGYSDWATSDISLPEVIWYRLNRRGPDFLIEYSNDGKTYYQMRIFHMHELGETTQDMGKRSNPETKAPVKAGIYACSPLDSTFTATFSELNIERNRWKAHE